MIWFVIAAEGEQRYYRRQRRGTGQRTTLYIKNAQFATSDPASVKRVSSTPEKAAAMKFGKLTAQRISEALNDPQRWGLKTQIEAIEEN